MPHAPTPPPPCRTPAASVHGPRGRGRRLAGLLAAAALAVAAFTLLRPPAAAQAAEGDGPDFDFYLANVAPVVETVCAECHANPRKRLGKYFVKPPPGRTVRASHHRDNFETILGLIEPGNPAGSLWLLKPLGPGQGGVTHAGGQRVALNSREYGAMVDFINGVKLPVRTFAPPAPVPGQPDFRFYVARIAPTLAQVCAECHAAPGKGKLSLVVAARGQTLTLEQHYANFRTVLGLSTPAQPERSRFLLKPLAVVDGGVAHKGGDRIRRGDPNHMNWLAFLRGEPGPDLAKAAPDGPRLLEAELTLEAESMERDTGLEVRADPLAPEKGWVVAGTRPGRLWQRVRLPEAGDYRVRLDVRGGPGPLLLQLDDEPPVEVEIPAEERPAEVGPALLLDGRAPLRALRGEVLLADGALRLDGRGAEASFLAPAEKDHRAVEVVWRQAPEDDGGDDAWLLFDMLDADNGKLAGLVDGGRRFVMGVLEGGTARILATAKAFPPSGASEGDAPPARTVRVDLFEGVAVGRLDGQPLAFLHLDRHLGQGAFGVRSHGVLEVQRLAAIDQFPVHTSAFGTGPILRLPAGVHTLGVELPLGGAALDRIVLTLVDDD